MCMYACMYVCMCVYECTYVCMYTDWPTPVAARSKAWTCGGSIMVSNPECCALSGRGLRVILITRLEESYRV
jgi:hypothetical protein